MWSVFCALIPAGIFAVWAFGISSLFIIVISIVSAMLFEYLIQKFLLKQKSSIHDGSAALTGLLLAYNLSSRVPLWLPVVGTFFAIAVVKQAFGGLGKNIFNPALAARAFLLISWPQFMTVFPQPFRPDALTCATPLSLVKEGKAGSISEMGLSYLDLFFGNRCGCLGEVCVAVLLLAALFLLLKGYISWHIPLSFIGTTLIFSWIFDKQGLFKGDILFSLLSGGLVLGAFFMATDYVTSPLTAKAKLIFGFGCGLLTFIIRRWASYPEGVSYAILMMNSTVALLERFLRPRIYGTKVK